MNLIILAGGLAKRIYPISKNVPKLLIELHNKPFAYYLFKYYEKFKFTRIILCVNHLKDEIYNFFNSNNFNLNIKFIEDPLGKHGTGAAVLNAMEKFEIDHSLIAYGDSYLTIDFDKFNKKFNQKLASTLVINKNLNSFDKSNVYEYNKSFIYDAILNEKKRYTHIDYGLSFIIKSDIKNFFMNTSEGDLKFFFDYQSKKCNLNFLQTTDQFYEIGSFRGIERFKDEKPYQKFL